MAWACGMLADRYPTDMAEIAAGPQAEEAAPPASPAPGIAAGAYFPAFGLRGMLNPRNLGVLRRDQIQRACAAGDARELEALEPTRAELERVKWLFYFYDGSPLGAALAAGNFPALDYMEAAGVRYTGLAAKKVREHALQAGVPAGVIAGAAARGLLE